MWDIALVHGTAVTVDPAGTVIQDAAVCVKDGDIAYIGTHDSMPEKSDRTVDVTGRIVMPGLVNAHSHCQHNLMRGGPSDGNWSTIEWLHNALHPAMSVYTGEDAYAAARLYCLEALMAGITTTIENADYSAFDHIFDAGMKAYKESGLRVLYGDVFADQDPAIWDERYPVYEARSLHTAHQRPPFPIRSTDGSLNRIESRMRDHGRGGRITICPSPMFPLVNTAEGLLRASDLAQEFNTQLLIHAGIESSDRQFGMSDVAYLSSLGLLKSNVVAAHMIDVQARDIDLLRRAEVKIAYCPVSNAWGSHGIAPVRDYLNAGIAVGLGTDDPNANQSVNLLSDLKVGALMQSLRYGPSAIGASELVEMATLGGAKCAGLAARVGSLEIGKSADIVVVDASGPNMTPMYSANSALVYQALGGEVQMVMVEGELLLEAGIPTRWDAQEVELLLQEARAASRGVVDRARLNGDGV